MLPIVIPWLVCTAWTTDLLDDIGAWEARPDWVAPDSVGEYSLEPGEAVHFSVKAAGCAMKWRRDLRGSPVELTPYLVIEMRATGLRHAEGQYLLWFDDGTRDGRTVVAYDDALLDGRWHTLAVDLPRIGLAADVTAAAVHVVAGEDGATLEVRRLSFAVAPPEGSRVLPEVGRSLDPIVLDLGAAGDWTEQPSWLGNPGECRIVGHDGGLRLEVASRGKGMKWSRDLAEPVELAGRRYVTMAYRAWGGGPSDYALALLGDGQRGEQYAVVCPGQALRQDGEQHLVSVLLGNVPSAVTVVRGLALQVQAAEAGAWMVVERVVLSDAPQRQPVESLALFETPHRPGLWRLITGYPTVDQPHAPDHWGLDALPGTAGLEGVLPAGTLTACGVPFSSAGEAAQWLRWGAPGDIEVAVRGRGSELFLLVAAGMVGVDDPIRGGGPLTWLPGPDRFVAEIRYQDGGVECIPAIVPPTDEGQWRWGLPEGICVLRCPLDPNRFAESAVLRLRTEQAALALLGVTLGEGQALFAPPGSDLHRLALPSPPPVVQSSAEPVHWVSEDPEAVHLETATTRVTLSRTGVPTLLAVYHKLLGRNILARPTPLLGITLDGEPVLGDDLVTSSSGLHDDVYELTHDGDELHWRLCWTSERGGVGFSLEATMGRPGRVEVTYLPIPLEMGGVGEPGYCFPSITPAIGSANGELSAPYAGWGIRHPFLAVQTADSSASVMLEARDPGVASLSLSKRGSAVAVSVVPRPVDVVGEVVVVPGYRLKCLAGDWHRALEEYRAGLPEAVAPRPAWVSGIWNFRQRFLYWLDPLWVDPSRPVDLWPAVREAEEAFGGLEYLHIFDWGNVPGLGRIYHRPGDPDPSAHWPGGYAAMRSAIDELQTAGIPVGLYIEGYLLETKGPLGQRIGERVAIIDEAGQPRYWPDATEVFACPWVAEWRQIQAETYARAATNLGPSGLYIDEFGFCSPWRNCYATDHGHPVPMNSIEAEQGFVREVRRALDEVDPSVILYTEESPPDSNTHLQDASFTYAMNQCFSAGVPIPLNLYRFVHPGFKTIEILYCDKPTGSWATGVAWTFFNGEAIWLEGPSGEWFAPQTLAMIRKCHRLLSEHSQAFTSQRVTPLVPTVVSGIHANRFESEEEVVFTLCNEAYTAYDGPVLVMPEGLAGPATDLWNETEATISEREGQRVLHARVGPRSVGCVAVRRR